MINKTEKIIVIGAGAAGVYGGYLLKQLGYHITILEARERVGGRVYSVEGVDLGGSWISTQQPRIYKICRELGFELVPQFEEGKNILFMNNVRNISGEEFAQGFDINKIITKQIDIFNTWADKLDLASEFYQQLDKIDARSWIQNNISDFEATGQLQLVMT